MMGEWNVKREMCYLSQSLEVVYEQIGVSWLWIQSDNIRGKFIAVRGFWSQSFNVYKKGKKWFSLCSIMKVELYAEGPLAA